MQQLSWNNYNMKHFCFLILYISLSLSLSLNNAFADEALWEQFNSAGMTAYQRGNYSEAIKHFEDALKEAKKFGDEYPRYATSLNNLALLYYTLGDYTKAEPLYARSLAIFEKALGPDHPDVATSLNNLAELYRTLGDYAKAEPLLKRSLAIWEKKLGPDHPEVATCLENLADLYRTTKRIEEAEKLEERAAKIRAMKR